MIATRWTRVLIAATVALGTSCMFGGDDPREEWGDFESCDSEFLMTRDALSLLTAPPDARPICSVPRSRAVSPGAMERGETTPSDGPWLPVRYELCQGWVLSSSLRCPEQGETPSWRYLDVPYHNQLQETDRYLYDPNTSCMGTALTMVLDYLGLEDDVNAVLARLAEISLLAGGYDPNCSENPVCASAGAVTDVAMTYCARVDAHDGWTKGEVVSALTDDRPVFALVTGGLIPGSVGHAVVIIGYLNDGAQLVYHDPWNEWGDALDRGNAVASWEELAVSWAGPVDVGDPLSPEGHAYFGLSCSR